MSYTELQGDVDLLVESNRQLTTSLIDAEANAKTARDATKVSSEKAETERAATEALVPQIAAIRQDVEVIRDVIGQHRADAEVARDDALTKPALVKTELARAVESLRIKEREALQGADYLESLHAEHIRPSLVLDFAKGEYWKQGAYPWIKETLDPATDLTFTRGSTATYFDADGVMQTAAVDEMRIDHDPLTGEPLGVLIEPSRTNHLSWSNAFAGGWGGYLASDPFTADVFAPDQSMTASVLTSADVTGVHHGGISIRHNQATGGAQYTLSCFAKAGRASYLNMGFDNGSGYWGKGRFNLLTGEANFSRAGSAGGVPAVDISEVYTQKVKNGWIRCVVVVKLTGGVSNVRMQASLENSNIPVGDDESEVYVWGAQMESGSYPTSYIPTNGAAVTRSEDDLTSTPSDHFSDDEGSILIETSPTHPPAFESSSITLVNSSSGSHAYKFFVDWSSQYSDNSTGFTVEASGRRGYHKFPALSASEQVIFGLSYAPGKAIYSLRGEIGQDSIATNPRGIDSVSFPRNIAMHHKSVTYYPHALSATELEALTMPVNTGAAS